MTTRNKVRLLEYNIAPGVRAFSTMRHGGVSLGEYEGFNINPYCGDDADHVAANKAQLAQELGIDVANIILPHQVHGVELRMVTPDFMSSDGEVRQMEMDGVDGVLTSMIGVCIGVSTADCIPVLLYDADRHAACAIHAGWRGTVRRIAQKAAEEMSAAFHSDPKSLKAVIGPGISLDSFEVGQEVYDEFASANFDMDKISKFMGKWHIDLPECNRRQLLEVGLIEENIFVSGIDTLTSPEFFSARRQGIRSGRIYTAIMLEDTK